jgi:tRNA threonylcarbamoyl adenosine modification protein (Sua5/YciO/YrdC/YwlC family)
VPSLVFDCADPAVREQALTTAAAHGSNGNLVVLPTDTVYGIGADAFNAVAVSSLLAAKGRGRDMPVPVLVGSWNTIEGLVSTVTAEARELIEAFWPGELTLIVEHAPSLAWDLGDARGTVAIRMPLHPVAIELLERTGPMAVSSANKTGHPPARTAQEAIEQLSDQVPVFLDAGPVAEGISSTIVDLTSAQPSVLRTGTVTIEALRAVVPRIVAPAVS